MRKSILAIKALSVFCFFMLSIPHSYAEETNVGVNFRPITLTQALAAAKVENKPVYVHGYTDWCHFCKYMKDSVYTDKEVGDFFNKNFISITIDMEKEGKKLNDSLQMHTYPAMIFYDTNGEIMHRAAGRRYKQPLLELGKEALDPRRQMRTFKNKYDSGTATPKEVQFYFRMQEIAGMDAQPMLNDYLMKQPTDSLLNQNNWRIMYDIIKDPNLPIFQRFIENKAALSEKYTADSVENKIITLYNSKLMRFVQQLDSIGYENLKRSIMLNTKLDIREKICALADLNKAKMKSDWETYKELSGPFVEKYAMDDYRRLIDVSSVYYERFNADKTLLALAGTWTKRSVSISDTYKGNHLLASITYMQGDKEEALKIANHAVELAKGERADYRKTTQLIAVIEKNMGK